VRAAGLTLRGGVLAPCAAQYNCHPFTCGRYLFMHNGNVHDFTKIRRALLERLRDCLFEWLSGTTDSELLFALFLNQVRPSRRRAGAPAAQPHAAPGQLPDCVTLQPPEVLADAMKAVVRLVVEATGGEPSSINVACTDGESVVATRFRNGAGQVPPSLYYHTGALPGASWDLPSSGGLGGLTSAMTQDGLLVSHDPAPHVAAAAPQLSSSYDGGGVSTLLRRGSFERRKPSSRQSLLVSSEPLSEEGAADFSQWRMFAPNTMLVATPRWHGGERDGERALRCELQDSEQAADELPAHSEEAVVVLDMRFESLEHIAAIVPMAKHAANASASAPAGATASAAAELPPRCPPRAPPAAGWPIPTAPGKRVSYPGSAAGEMDFQALSFDQS
jgi:hypothetical protein